MGWILGKNAAAALLREREHRIEACLAKAVPTYTISPDGKSITFHPCELTSPNSMDVLYRYCVRCDRFLDDVAREARYAAEKGKV